MSSPASATLAAVVRFNAQTAARDKVCRFIQYISRFVWWWLQKHGYTKETIVRFKQLEGAISTARKLFRLGKSIDVLQSAAQTIHHPDLFVRCTVTFSKVNTALFLLFDHIVWGCRVGFLPNTDKHYWSVLSNRFWLVSLIANLLRDFHELKVLVSQYLERQQRVDRLTASRGLNASGSSSLSSWAVAIVGGCRDRPEVFLDSVKNACDVFLPLSNLDLIDVPAGALGLLGALSSFIGVLTIVDGTFKLRPS